MCPDNSIRKEISACTVQAPRRRSCVESGEDGLGGARLPDGVGRAQPESNRRFPAIRQGVLPTELCAHSREEERGMTSSR